MALVKVDFFSKSLMRTVTFNAIIPVDKREKEENHSTERKPLKTLYLLHGIFGNYTDWVCGTRIEKWAYDYNLAVIMPSGENKFYIDNERTLEFYSKFIGEELVEFTRKMFPLSNKREDTYIGGLSMGGYGALVNGLVYNETFGCIVALSAALIIDKFANAIDGEDVVYLEKRTYLESVFGDLDKVKGSNKDYKALVLKKNVAELPKIYMACGLDDRLLDTNRDYRDFLLKHGVDLYYEEGEGNHNWEFWDKYIHKALDWLLLNEVK